MKTSSQFTQVLKPQSKGIKVIWFAMTGSVFIYLFLVYISLNNLWSSGVVLIESSFEYPLYFACIIFTISSVLFTRIYFSDKRISKQLKNEINIEELATNDKTKKIDEERLVILNEMPEKELRLLGLSTWYVTPFMVQLTLNEIITVLGLILCFVTRDPATLIPFAIVTIVLNIAIYNGLNRVIEKGKSILESPALYEFI